MAWTLNRDGLEDSRTDLLKAILAKMESVVVAFSGGVDSSLLAAVASHVLGKRALMVTAMSATFSKSEREDAKRLAEKHGWNHRFIETREGEDPRFTANPPDRCYYCKSELYSQLARIAKEEGCQWLADGSNVDDRGDYRPGVRAKTEFHVRSPLQEAGFRKVDVRQVARLIGLDVAEKPAAACLASRLPYGTAIVDSTLRAIEKAEAALQASGFKQVRVRIHGDVARIEVESSEIDRLLQKEERERIATALQALGFRYVAVDLQGYRTGSMNEVLGNR